MQWGEGRNNTQPWGTLASTLIFVITSTNNVIIWGIGNHCFAVLRWKKNICYSPSSSWIYSLKKKKCCQVGWSRHEDFNFFSERSFSFPTLSSLHSPRVNALEITASLWAGKESSHSMSFTSGFRAAACFHQRGFYIPNWHISHWWTNHHFQKLSSFVFLELRLNFKPHHELPMKQTKKGGKQWTPKKTHGENNHRSCTNVRLWRKSRDTFLPRVMFSSAQSMRRPPSNKLVLFSKAALDLQPPSGANSTGCTKTCPLYHYHIRITPLWACAFNKTFSFYFILRFLFFSLSTLRGETKDYFEARQWSDDQVRIKSK